MSDHPCMCGREIPTELVPFWVQCDKCERWVHGQCSSFNSKQEAEETDEYRCPPCQQGRKATLVMVDKQALTTLSPATNLKLQKPSPVVLSRPAAIKPAKAVHALLAKPGKVQSAKAANTQAPHLKIKIGNSNGASPRPRKPPSPKTVPQKPVPSPARPTPSPPAGGPSPILNSFAPVSVIRPPSPESKPTRKIVSLVPVPKVKAEQVDKPMLPPSVIGTPSSAPTLTSPMVHSLSTPTPVHHLHPAMPASSSVLRTPSPVLRTISPAPRAPPPPPPVVHSPSPVMSPPSIISPVQSPRDNQSPGRISPSPKPPSPKATGNRSPGPKSPSFSKADTPQPTMQKQWSPSSLKAERLHMKAESPIPLGFVANGNSVSTLKPEVPFGTASMQSITKPNAVRPCSPPVSPAWKKQKVADGTSVPVRENDRLDDSEWLELMLTNNHHQRPLWVTPLKNDCHRIILETFNPYYPQAQHFMVTIAEPISRTAHIHEWELTSDSLYAAVSFGINSDIIVARLSALSKVELHPDTIAFIERHTQNFGKAILVLENQTYYVEGKDQVVIDQLHRDKKVREAIRREPDGSVSSIVSTALITDTGSTERVFRFPLVSDDPSQKAGLHTKTREELKRRCRELGLPLSMFYDFRNDRENPTIDIDLKPTTRLRPYQEMALTKMFTNGRARSGIIVLPCGAGKTLVGVTATTTIKRRTLVLCLNTVSVEQWVHQYKMWSTVDTHRVTKFTAEHKEMPGDVLVTTFNMLSFSGERASRSEEVMEQVKAIEWGLVILDEVHVVPAETFRKVLEIVHAHCILGLTATLLREDEKIDDLKFLIGPKLYEANWLELSKQGSLATVQCVEVHCPMTKEFYEEYLNADPSRKTQLYIMNPVKFWCTQALIEYHERCGDKIIVFSDSVPALHEYAKKLNRPFIEGKVGQAERMAVLDHFKRHPEINTIFITKVGDTSIDLPEATVIIQISSHFGSRRQEAQRLGRILRPKGKSSTNSKAYFYSLISCDTKEMYYCSKRQQFLLDQGYAYKVIHAHAILDQWERMVRRKTGEVKKKLGTLEEQKKLLDTVLALTSETLKEDEAKREAAERSAREAMRQRRAAAMTMHPILRNMFRKR